MIYHILNTGFIKGKKAAGLVYKILPDGNTKFLLVIAKLEKGNISIDSSYINIKDSKAVKQLIESHVPLVLLVDGKGIIHRKLLNDEGDRLRVVLPNANKDDFFVQNTSSFENSVFVSIARKELLKGIVKELIDAGLKPVEIILGPFCINQIIPFLDIANNELNIDEYKLEFKDNLLVDFKIVANSGTSPEIRMGNEILETEKLLPFAAAFRYFFQSPIVSTDIDLLYEIKKDFLWGRFLKIAGMFAIIFTFLLLLINFLVFDNINKKYQEASLKFESNKMIIDEVDSLKTVLQKRKEFMTQTGLLGQTKFSYFGDRIASMMPSGVSLSIMNFNAPAKKINDNEKINFTEQIIVIKGSTTDSYKINSWLKGIRSETWVKDVTIENYSQPLDRNYGQFELNIFIR